MSWYNKKLNSIRDELNKYLQIEKCNMMTAKEQESTHGLIDSFLTAMNLCDDEEDEALDDYHGEDEFFPAKEYLSNGKKIKKEKLDQYISSKEETFSETLLKLIDEKGMKDSVVYKKASIDRRLFSKIRSDADYSPSKKTAISFCIALELSLQETTILLEKAGYALSDSSRFDLIIKYMITHKEYNIHLVNIVLREYGESTL